MKKLATVAAVLIATAAMAEMPGNGLQVMQGTDGTPVVAMDILAALRNERVQESRWPAKPFVALGEGVRATGEYAIERPGRFTVAVLGTYATVRLLQGKLGQDIDGLGRAAGLSSKKGNSAAGNRAGASSQFSQTATDNGINVSQTRGDGEGDMNIEIHIHRGDNNNPPPPIFGVP